MEGMLLLFVIEVFDEFFVDTNVSLSNASLFFHTTPILYLFIYLFIVMTTTTIATATFIAHRYGYLQHWLILHSCPCGPGSPP